MSGLSKRVVFKHLFLSLLVVGLVGAPLCPKLCELASSDGIEEHSCCESGDPSSSQSKDRGDGQCCADHAYDWFSEMRSQKDNLAQKQFAASNPSTAFIDNKGLKSINQVVSPSGGLVFHRAALFLLNQVFLI
jgi:hypothetical protein